MSDSINSIGTHLCQQQEGEGNTILPGNLHITLENLPLMEQLGELLPGGFFVYQAHGDGELIVYNKKILSLFGCDIDEELRVLTGNTFKGMVHPDDYPAAMSSIQEQVACNICHEAHVRYRFIRNDGSMGMMDSYSRLVSDQMHGDVFYVFVQDISSHYLSEQARRGAELQQLISSMTAHYDIVYLVDMSDGSMNLCKMAPNMIESKEQFQNFVQARNFTLQYVIHPRDRKHMEQAFDFGYIRERLKEESSYDTTYCIIKNGATLWGEMNITSVGEDKIILSMAEHDLAVAQRLLEDKRYNEYIALYAVDIDTEKIRAIKCSPEYSDIETGKTKPYSAAVKAFAEKNKGEAREFFYRIADLDYVRQELATDDKRTFLYKSDYLLKGRWVDIITYVLSRHDDGTPALFTLGFCLADAMATERLESQNRLKENMQMIGGLASEYYTLYYFNLSEGVFSVYSLDGNRFPETARIVAEGEDPFVMLQRFGASPLVHPADSHLFANFTVDTVRKKLAHSKKFTIRFRRFFGEKCLWCDMDVVKYEDINEEANAIAIGFCNRDADVRSEQALNRSFKILASDKIPEKAIDELLVTAGEYYGAERCYIFENNDKKKIINNTYEWCAAGIEPMIDKLQDVPMDVCDGWYKQFDIQGAFFMDALDSEHNSPEAVALLEMQGISSLVAAPLISGDKVVGFIGVDNPALAKGDITVLKHIATVVYSIILKRRENDEEHITLRKLSDTFMSVYYADLSRDYLHNWKIDELGEATYGGITHYSTSMRGYVSEGIADRDRERCLRMTSPEYILEKFKTCKRFSVDMTDITLGYDRNYVFDFVKVSNDGNQFVMSCTDVTESMRKERAQQQQLEEALSMAQSANRAKTVFLNNMSHDIRTPMNAIIGFTGLAANHIDDKQLVKDYLSKISQSSAHLLSLINDVLDMSRIESGKMTLDEKPEHLPEIIDTLYDIVQADIQAKQHHFSVDTTGVTDTYVICDRLRVSQVLLNILTNAIKYTAPHGTLSMCVAEQAAESSDCATYIFTIRDNGIGMDDSFMQVLFDPFTRATTPTAGATQGTGLGMAITKSIIDMMEGTIDVQSTPGKGTKVTIVLPLKLQVEEHVAEHQRVPVDNLDLQGKRILLVDDNELNREIAATLLEEYGCIVSTAADGDIAVECVRSAHPDDYDLVLMDIQMPTLDGYEATRQIRALGTEASHLPIIAMTANAFEEDRRAAIDAGMDEHIAKPIDIDRLRSVLARFLLK